MSSIPLSKEDLFNYLIAERICVDKEVLSKARHGDGASLSEIGDIYYKGQSYDRALDWYRLGAANDNAYSQFKIGDIYEYTRGFNYFGKRNSQKYQNYQTAMAWYQTAHNNGCSEATYAIGRWYKNGTHVSRNMEIGIQWITEAANNGSSDAQRELGYLYETDYLKNDVQSALAWYKKSFQQGDAVSKEDTKKTDEQKKCLELQKETTEQKLEIESLKKKLDEYEQQLKAVQLEKSINEEDLDEEYSHCTDSDETLEVKN